MKVMLTLNMPNSSGMPLHKLIADVGDHTIETFWETLCDNEFVKVNQFYVSRSQTGETIWDDLGIVLLNTAHIAKVQEYIEKIAMEDDNRPFTRQNQRPQYRR